ncbi:hypothetical protein MRX96_019351 [Rhipicephalus microplus]
MAECRLTSKAVLAPGRLSLPGPSGFIDRSAGFEARSENGNTQKHALTPLKHRARFSPYTASPSRSQQKRLANARTVSTPTQLRLQARTDIGVGGHALASAARWISSGASGSGGLSENTARPCLPASARPGRGKVSPATPRCAGGSFQRVRRG